MKEIRITLDRHFPYDYKKLQERENHFKINKLILKQKFPSFLKQINHITQLYLRSFQSHIILGNRRSVLLLGLLYLIFKPKKVTLVGYEIIFNLKKSLRHKLVVYFWRLAIRKIDYLVVQSQWEVNYLADIFKTSYEKFKVIPFYTDDGASFQKRPDGDYIFAAGRMERDFTCLLKALQGTDIPVKIVADKSQINILEDFRTPHTELLYNISKEDYLELLSKAKLVVIPLFNGNASRGQVVLLEAMRFAKPVICSDVPGTREYIKDNETAWLVPPENDQLLKKKILEVISDEEGLKETGLSAQQEQQTRYSQSVFVENYIKMIKSIVKFS